MPIIYKRSGEKPNIKPQKEERLQIYQTTCEIADSHTKLFFV